MLSAEIVVDLLVIVVSQALIARAVAITAIDYIDRTLQNSLECPSIISHNSTNMASTASNRIIEHERIKHQAFSIGTEQTSLNIRSFDSHLSGESFEQRIQHRKHHISVGRLLRYKGNFRHIRLKIMRQTIFYAFPLIIRAGVSSHRFVI